ncbi:hypothetical protein D3C85_509890 [compost metagenome]
MQINGNLDLMGNYLKNLALEPVESWPLEPKPGTFIFKGKRIFVCLEISDGVPVWLPMSSELQTHVHDQFVASTTWEIDHQLQTAGCIVQVLSGDNKAIMEDEVEFSFNHATIRFSEPQAGRAILIMGATEGIPRPQVAYEQVFTNEQVWVINHQLGYLPVIRCFVGNMEVQPTSIVHNDEMTMATVTFNSPISGRARCV